MNCSGRSNRALEKKKVGNADLNPLKLRGSPQNSNFKHSISTPTHDVKIFFRVGDDVLVTAKVLDIFVRIRYNTIRRLVTKGL